MVFSFVEQIRSNPALAGASVIMLTSAHDPSHGVRTKQLGIAAYLRNRSINQLFWRHSSIPFQRGLGEKQAQQPAIPADTTSTSSNSESKPVRSLRILLAEDNRINQKVALRMLGMAGHQVTVAENGKRALAMLEQNAFDAVLMDVQMPEMDGFETTAAIRKEEEHTGLHLPIIAMTAHALMGDHERCLAAGNGRLYCQADDQWRAAGSVSHNRSTNTC